MGQEEGRAGTEGETEDTGRWGGGGRERRGEEREGSKIEILWLFFFCSFYDIFIWLFMEFRIFFIQFSMTILCIYVIVAWFYWTVLCIFYGAIFMKFYMITLCYLMYLFLCNFIWTFLRDSIGLFFYGILQDGFYGILIYYFYVIYVIVCFIFMYHFFVYVVIDYFNVFI